MDFVQRHTEIFIFGGLIVIILLLLVFTLIPTPLSSPASNVAMLGPYNMNTNTVLFTDSTFLNNSSVTFQGFLYLEKLQKTGIVTPCSSTDPSLPNCDTGRYSLCSCNGNDCKQCYHQGYINIINFNDICKVEVLGAPDSSRQKQATVQFTVKTQSSGNIVDSSGNTVNPELHAVDPSGKSTNSDIYFETFVLPQIPFQKWIMLTISREGRRFDFYYNDVLVLSKQTSTVLYNTPLTNNVTVGDSNINGSCGYFTLYNTIQTSREIANQYASFTTTRGSPMFNETPQIGLTNLSLDRVTPSFSIPSICSSGDCTGVSTRPSMPYYEWSSSYA